MGPPTNHRRLKRANVRGQSTIRTAPVHAGYRRRPTRPHHRPARSNGVACTQHPPTPSQTPRPRRDGHVPLTAWSTGDLLTERQRLQAVLDEVPPDRSADLAALAESRRDMQSKLCESRIDVATLECRRRPFRDRRKPDVDLIIARHNLGYFTRQADLLDAEIVSLESSQHRRHSHFTPTTPSSTKSTPSTACCTSASAKTSSEPLPSRRATSRSTTSPTIAPPSAHDPTARSVTRLVRRPRKDHRRPGNDHPPRTNRPTPNNRTTIARPRPRNVRFPERGVMPMDT